MASQAQQLTAAVIAVSLPHLHLVAHEHTAQQVLDLCHQAWDFARTAVDEAGGMGPFVEGERALWVAPSLPVGIELALGISRSLSQALHKRGHHQPVGAALGYGALLVHPEHGVHGAEALRVRSLSSVWIGAELACTLAVRERLTPPPGLGVFRAPRALEERCGQAFHLLADYR